MNCSVKQSWWPSCIRRRDNDLFFDVLREALLDGISNGTIDKDDIKQRTLVDAAVAEADLSTGDLALSTKKGRNQCRQQEIRQTDQQLNIIARLTLNLLLPPGTSLSISSNGNTPMRFRRTTKAKWQMYRKRCQVSTTNAAV